MTKLDFDYLERQRSRQNLLDVKQEIQERSSRLTERIQRFSNQFGIPEQTYWDALDADPMGPLASTLAREARRQNIHEKHAADFIARMEHVAEFEKLPSQGPRALYLTSDGLDVTGRHLGGATKPSKSIDFRWITNRIRCLAAQKYTKQSGGNQDSQFKELQQLLRNYLQRTSNDTAFFILVDGPYYNADRISQLNALRRTQRPKSYVTSVNSLQGLLTNIVEGG